jgi:hypothetical protein
MAAPAQEKHGKATYNGDDDTEPRQPFAQRPDPIAEIFLNNQ